MPPVTEEELKKHLNNIVDAFYALSPTRNYVLQLLELLPEDYATMVRACPELFENEETRKILKDILGMRIGEQVQVSGGLADTCKRISQNVSSNFFGSYNWEELQTKLSDYLGRDLPNVNKELCNHKIRMAISEPTLGNDIKKVLTAMVKDGEGDNLAVELSRMMEKTSLDRTMLLDIKRFLTQKLGILQEQEELFALDHAFSKYKDLFSDHFGEEGA